MRCLPLPAFPLLLVAGALLMPAAARAEQSPRRVLEPMLENVAAAGGAGAAAYVDNGRGTWRGAAGVADVRTGRPLRPTDRFRVGSNTKTFVATVALQLVDEGRLSLSDTVESRLGGLLPYGSQVTLRQLLNHTSGVPDFMLETDIEIYRVNPFHYWSPRELVEMVSSLPQEFPAGSSWAYSNTGYVLAGMMIEQATHDSLEHQVERRIIRPLGLSDTSFPTRTPWLDGHFARGYSLDYDEDLNPIPGTLLDLTVRTPSNTWAAGNVVSTFDDLSHFFRALLRGRLLSPARLADMKTTVETSYPGTRYGLGLFMWDGPCGPLYGHGGGMPGYENSFKSTPDGSRQWATFINFSVAPDPVTEAYGELEGATQQLIC